MKLRSILLAAAFLAPAGAAAADDVDFERFLATASGAAGVAAAVAGLGPCDTPITWAYAYDEAKGAISLDALFLGCTLEVADEDPVEKSVVATFTFFGGNPALTNLQYLP